jgi:hypothetical protein
MRSAAELSGAELARVQAKVLERGLPWSGETAALLVGRATGSLPGEGEITIGSASEIADVVEGMLDRPPFPSAPRAAEWKAQGEKVLRLLKQTMPLKGYKERVRFVIRGDVGDWYSGPLVPPEGRR